MKIIKPYTEILTEIDETAVMMHLERCGRVCYKSEERITLESAPQFIRQIIARGHESVLEHFSITVRFVCDRGVSHELVRHRIASFSQESTRYCNYGHEGEITVIEPYFFYEKDRETDAGDWVTACYVAEDLYLGLVRNGSTPQEARSVLPNSLKTEVIMTANLREWRHFFWLRTAAAAHPQMRELTIPLLGKMQNALPVVFEDIVPEGM